jgi:hypothetical protein
MTPPATPAPSTGGAHALIIDTPTVGAEISGLRFTGGQGFYNVSVSAPTDLTTVREADPHNDPYVDPYAEETALLNPVSRKLTPVVETVSDELEETELDLVDGVWVDIYGPSDEAQPTPIVETVSDNDEADEDLHGNKEADPDEVFQDAYRVTSISQAVTATTRQERLRQTYCMRQAYYGDQFRGDPKQWDAERGSVLGSGSPVPHFGDWTHLHRAQTQAELDDAAPVRFADSDDEDTDENGLVFLDSEDDAMKAKALTEDAYAQVTRLSAAALEEQVAQDFVDAGHSH